MATSRTLKLKEESIKSKPQLAGYPELEPYLLKGARRTADCKRLGNGSFGVVDEINVQGTLCAAKQLHGSLLDPRTLGVNRVIGRFVEECRIMSSVRHPNVVQFLGLHMFPSCSYPTLVMEQLAMSLEDLLNESDQKKEDIPLSLKVSILSDTAKGLVYLHNHNPQIIHRDLTSRNVLLTLSMQAKITDLGNALIIDSHTVAQTMTQTPGTAVYMPPEAVQSQARYDSAIDMFSYGHLALYIIIQEFPKCLLAATYTDEITKELHARSEIQRRSKYIDTLHQKVGKDHLLTRTIQRCLDNVPGERPSALQILESLEEMSKTANSFPDDLYYEYQQASKFDLIKMVRHGHKNRFESTASPSPYHPYVIDGPEEKGTTEYLELVDDPAPTRTEHDRNLALDKSEQIKVGVPGNLKLVSSKSSRSGSFRRGRGTMTKKEYTFKVTSSESTASLVYYEEKSKKTINLSDVAAVTSSPPTKSMLPDYPFELTLKGKDSPIKLIASSEDDRGSWVKALKEIISPSKPQAVMSSPQKRARIPSPPQDVSGSPNMFNNKAYNFLPSPEFVRNENSQPVSIVPTPSISSTKVTPVKPVSIPEQTPLKPVAPVTNQPHLESPTYEVPINDVGLYYYIDDPAPKLESDIPLTSHGKDKAKSVATPAVVTTTSTSTKDSEDYYTEMDTGVSYLRPSTSDAGAQSPESPISVVKALKRLSRFNSDQMEHLIEMLRTTVVEFPLQSASNPTPESAATNTCHVATPPPRPPKPSRSDPVTEKESQSLLNSRERPSQLSLPLNEAVEPSVYVNTIPMGNGKKNGKNKEPAIEKKDGEEVSVPKLVVESTDDDSTAPVQRRKSEGLLTTAATANAIKFKLARLLSETEATSKTFLLVTGDSPDSYEERPDWAKASTGTTPVHSPMLKDDHLSLLRQQALLMERSALQDLEEIGEGQFGKVYKATLVRARSEKMKVAVKTIKKYQSEKETSDFLREMGVMMDLMHPNIIHLYGIVQQESPWLVLQYLPNGDLKNYLVKNKRSVDKLINYMIDVAMGMHYIMEKGLVHRDLAARNVMVDEKETCKVADFGLLREIPKDNTIYQATTEMPWPIRWMAPESLDNREFSPASDVWSFGVLLWEMYYPNRLPYGELNNFQVPTKILSGDRLSIPPAYPSTVASIMKACWQRKPEKRPSFLLISTLLTNMSVQLQENS